MYTCIHAHTGTPVHIDTRTDTDRHIHRHPHQTHTHTHTHTQTSWTEMTVASDHFDSKVRKPEITIHIFNVMSDSHFEFMPFLLSI